jgi:hypothetical protein
MASLQQFPSGNFHIKFDFGGKRFKRSLKTKDKREAISRRARLEETLRLVELGRIELPESVDVPTFLLSDGKTNQKAVIREASLGDLFVRFFDSLPEGSLEPGSTAMMQIHQRHLERHFGKRLQLKLLRFSDLQGYVSKRSQDPGIRGRKLSPSTIKKEINTLRAVWKWALASDLIPKSTFPSQGLRCPKTDELPPFQTFEQILKQTKNLDTKSTEFKDLWATVFLTRKKSKSCSIMFKRLLGTNSCIQFSYSQLTREPAEVKSCGRVPRTLEMVLLRFGNEKERSVRSRLGKFQFRGVLEKQWMRGSRIDQTANSPSATHSVGVAPASPASHSQPVKRRSIFKMPSRVCLSTKSFKCLSFFGLSQNGNSHPELGDHNECGA